MFKVRQLIVGGNVLTSVSGISARAGGIGAMLPLSLAGSKAPKRSVTAGSPSRGPRGIYAASSGSEAKVGRPKSRSTSFITEVWSPGALTIAPERAKGEITMNGKRGPLPHG